MENKTGKQFVCAFVLQYRPLVTSEPWSGVAKYALSPASPHRTVPHDTVHGSPELRVAGQIVQYT